MTAPQRFRLTAVSLWLLRRVIASAGIWFAIQLYLSQRASLFVVDGQATLRTTVAGQSALINTVLIALCAVLLVALMPPRRPRVQIGRGPSA